MLFFGRSHTNADMNEFIKEPSEYSHVSDPNRLHVIRLKNEIKICGASSNEGASTILSDVLRTTPIAVSAGLLSTEASLQTIRCERKPIQLDHNGRLPFMLREADRGENFVLYEDDSMIIFTCEKNLSVLQECRRWFMDGTFSICLLIFQPSMDQIFTLRSVQKTIYCLIRRTLVKLFHWYMLYLSEMKQMIIINFLNNFC